MNYKAMNFFNMKPLFLLSSVAIFWLIFLSQGVYAQDKNQEKVPTTEEMATAEAERLGNLLKLEDWQLFYVDSILQHDYAALKKEMEELKKYKVENYNIYILTQDKWMEQIDRSYKKYFSEAQWAAYLKSGAAKAQKARNKRKAKFEKSK